MASVCDSGFRVDATIWLPSVPSQFFLTTVNQLVTRLGDKRQLIKWMTAREFH